jgi:hypothetical protein
VAATAAGLPRIVYRKLGVDFEPEQEEFARSSGDYTSGVFYDSFSTTAGLLRKVAAKLRELADARGLLTFAPLTAPVTIEWRSDFDEQARRGTSSLAAVEVHVVPIGAQSRSARVMADIAQALPSRTRDSGLIDAGEALNITRPGGAIMVSVAAQPTDGTNRADRSCSGFGWPPTARYPPGRACRVTAWAPSSMPMRSWSRSLRCYGS